jgi:hypothetical protein
MKVITPKSYEDLMKYGVLTEKELEAKNPAQEAIDGIMRKLA